MNTNDWNNYEIRTKRYELFKEFCLKSNRFQDKVVSEQIYYNGKWVNHAKSVTAEEQIDDEFAYNSQSAYVEWTDIVRGGHIVGFIIKNRYKKTRLKYIE